jgi:purine-nucleoside phosphorylase
LRDFAGARKPEALLVLGSGMGDVAGRLRAEESVAFAEIAGVDGCSVPGHSGRLSVGEWSGKRVLVFAGRLHYYEGHPWRAVTMLAEIAAFVGARVLLLTNAAGGIHDDLAPGSLMAIRDHFEWTRGYCWRRPGPGGIGTARPSPYAARLLPLLQTAAEDLEIRLHAGVYAAVTGPCYETPAEIRALRSCGADAVGMSTAREVEAAHARGLKCAAISCITNRAAGLGCGPISHQEVLSTASTRCEQLARLIERFLVRL